MSEAEPGGTSGGRESGALAVAGSPVAGLLSRSSDLVLAGLVVAIIALMILPLPRLLIDSLVAINITIGVLLVLMGIYVSSALQFSAFPSVLLITTLFRLALSVSTTRMILLEGDAGAIIDTFGALVAGGNVVVGLVVFLIITLVQFLVIAKGAERVAEVGARFTLDAMPGKQLSIDSDLRSGLIEKSEARRKRTALATESQLHGSLDGAMKFVKGDAIAGVVIIIINLLGGLAVGVFQVGMPAGEAMQKYSILTIGDGLVAQIPALFGATAAGLIVTRVGDGSPGEHLGEAIQGQFRSVPRAILLAGVICLLFAFVPGFPTGVFLVMGTVLFATGAFLVPTLKGFFAAWSAPAVDSLRGEKRAARSRVEATESVTVREARPLLLTLPAASAAEGGDVLVRDAVQEALQRHHERTGLVLPPIGFDWHGREDGRWALDLFSVPACSGTLAGPADAADADAIARTCLLAIRRNARLFVGIEETSRLLGQVSERSPEIVRELERTLSVRSIAVLVQNLVEEEVPVHNLSVALEQLVQASQTDKDLDNLTEYARIALGRQISHRYATDGRIRAVALSLEVEAELLQAVRAEGGARQLAANPALMNRLGRALDEAIERVGADAIVTPVVLRRPLRGIVVERHLDVPVLSYQEIARPFELDLLERVEVASEEDAGAEQDVGSAA